MKVYIDSPDLDLPLNPEPQRQGDILRLQRDRKILALADPGPERP